MSYFHPEDVELLRLARMLGGVSKAKELLKVMRDRSISIDMLLDYLKSTGYKLPSPLERRIEELERRILILEGKPPEAPPQPPSGPQLKEWSDSELEEYLDYFQKRNKFTFLYFKILTEIDGRISRDDLIKKMSELSKKKFSGLALAGILSGITRSVTNQNYERLDWKDEDSQNFALNEKYREKMRNYFSKRAS